MSYAVRPARPDEREALYRLAWLDSARPLRGDVVVALADGFLVAAASLREDRVVADPFTPTTEAVALLRDHVRRLQASVAPPRPSRLRRLRAALA